MDEHGWLPSSIFPSSKFLPTRKLRRSASLEPKGTSGNSQSKRVTRRVRLQNSNPNPHTLPSKPIETSFQVTSLKLGWSALSHILSQAAATTTSMLQVAQNQQSLKHRHHSITVHRTNRGLHRGGGASATTPGKRHQKAANQELP